MLRVSVIIPHAGGWDLLVKCLDSLYRSKGVELETIIVENGSFEKISEDQIDGFPNVLLLRYDNPLGFAGACNRGVEAATGRYVFLLNNDATVEDETLLELSRNLDSDSTIAACQPKILSQRHIGQFDYSSACGGEIDLFGYPFARGRIFDTVEDDTGQYDNGGDIFWGAGNALMIRRDLYLEAGGLEERFWAHMEEIDLQWRLQLLGYRIVVVPQVVSYHLGAATIKAESFSKIYFNHRNNLAMLFRNYGLSSLVKYMPLRSFLDVITVIRSLFGMDLKRTWAILRAWVWFLKSLPYLIKVRFRIQRTRRIKEADLLKRIYPRSVVWQYFIRKRQTYQQLVRKTN